MKKVVLAASCALDGAQDDHAAEWPQSQALAELQASEARTARREAAGQALCTQERGPNSAARWTAEGHLVCTTRRGEVAQQQAGAGLVGGRL